MHKRFDAARGEFGCDVAVKKLLRRLVSLHHGSIQVESALGRGSTFKVLLPIGNIDAAPSIRAPPRNPEAQR